MLQAGMLDLAEQSRSRQVVEMTEATANPLLERPGIVTIRQHPRVMVAFKHQSVANAKRLDNVSRDCACVGENAETVASIGKHKLHRLTRIVRDGKWKNLHLANIEWSMAVDHAQLR